MKLRSIRTAGFEASRLAPAEPPDGSSLVEKVAAWVSANAGDAEFTEVRYQADGGTHFALLVYAGD